MCLVIDEKYHGGGSSKVVSRRATQDILVYKVLKPWCGGYYAPYRSGHEWVMGVRQKTPMIVNGTFYSYVDRGLHSCRTRHHARRRLFIGTKIFPAVIPKGAYLYYGTRGDIVSTELIVYPDFATLKKARGAIGPGVPREKIAI